MSEFYDIKPEDLFRYGKKSVLSESIKLISKDGRILARYPIDKEVLGIYLSPADGFLPPELAFTDFLNQALHYGEGGFEGIRIYYTPFGAGFPELGANVARLIWSSLEFDGRLERDIFLELENLRNGRLRLEPMTPKELFEEGKRAILEDRLVKVIKASIVDERFNSSAKHMFFKGEYGLLAVKGYLTMNGEIEPRIYEYSPGELDTLIKMIAFTSRLVSIDYLPKDIEMVLSGYFRPHFWVSGEMGLKVSTVGKPMYFAVETLPWSVYLNEDDYKKGIDILIAPNPRISHDMPTDKKIAGNYVNSNKNVKFAIFLKYGEILAPKNTDTLEVAKRKYVEGSAENLFVLFEEGKKWVAYTPPVSDGCLPGTTRNRVIRTLEKMGIEVKYESLTLENIVKSKGAFFTGTGAQIIHIRSITAISELSDIANALRLSSEGKEKSVEYINEPKYWSKETYLINKGEKHPIIDKIQNNYKEMMITENLIDPAYSISIFHLSKLFELDIGDILRESGLSQRSIDIDRKLNPRKWDKVPFPREKRDIQERTRLAARIIAAAIRLKEKATGRTQLRRINNRAKGK